MNLVFRTLGVSLLGSLMLWPSLFSSAVQAGYIETPAVVERAGANYAREDLLAALDSDQLRAQLESYGVDPAQVRARVNAMTPAEIDQLNSKLADMPAGQGLGGVLLTVFILFVITDAICATDLFSFVHCIQ